MLVKDYILEIKKFFPKSFCEKIIYYYNNENLPDATVVSGKNKEIRNCNTRDVLQTVTFGEKILKNFITDKLWQAVEVYNKKFPYSQAQKISQLDFLKYEHNSYKVGYAYHTDMGEKVSLRQLSISICLNNDFTGGEFVFDMLSEKIQYPQNIGDVIIFPSNFMYPHQVNPITEGTRYALIGWVI